MAALGDHEDFAQNAYIERFKRAFRNEGLKFFTRLSSFQNHLLLDLSGSFTSGFGI